MAITTAMCTSFKKELFKAIHDFTSDTFKIALFTKFSESWRFYHSLLHIQRNKWFRILAGGVALTVVAQLPAEHPPLLILMMCLGQALHLLQMAHLFTTAVKQKAVAAFAFWL